MKGPLGRLIDRLINPVPQNVEAVIYGQYKGMAIRLRPVTNADGRVTEWIPDPEVVALVEAGGASSAAHPPTLPGPAQQPGQATAAPTVPDGFNPAGIDGL